MKTYLVSVEMTHRFTAVVPVEADNVSAAEVKVQRRIFAKTLHPVGLKWDEGVYVDGSFRTTGDVDDGKEGR